ncbi:MAG: phenylacetate-CoA oxygenase subunit PaaJ [Saprospiraceae bacterium]|nr:phenylacetate-CoA oxygenase subunit PaaJ [Saprospiraceae bacterium]
MALNSDFELKQKIREILSNVTDPEIPVITIEDLGIIRDILIKDDGKISVVITPTYTGCPAMDMITVEIKAALEEHGFSNTEVISVLDPEWTTDWISEAGRTKLREYGIAPPAQKTSDKSYLTGKSPVVACPLCKSENTEMISHFGSTPCKSLYKCLDCLEPFDYFKCH